MFRSTRACHVTTSNFANSEKARKLKRRFSIVGMRRTTIFTDANEMLETKTANDITICRTLRVVTIVQLQLFPSNSRGFGRLLGRSATLPDYQKDSSLTGFENPEGSWERQ